MDREIRGDLLLSFGSRLGYGTPGFVPRAAARMTRGFRAFPRRPGAPTSDRSLRQVDVRDVPHGGASHDRERGLLPVLAAGVTLNLALNVIPTSSHGAEGAALANVVSQTPMSAALGVDALGGVARKRAERSGVPLAARRP